MQTDKLDSERKVDDAMVKVAKRMKAMAEKLPQDRSAVPVAEAVAILKQFQHHEVRPDGRDRDAAGHRSRSRPTSSSAARSCCRTASASRCGWSCSPRATRPTRPRRPAPTKSAGRRAGREDQGRLDRFRRLHRRARHDGRGRSAGQGARSPRPDAFAACRHGHARRRPRPSRNTRPARSSSATTPAATSTPSSAS